MMSEEPAEKHYCGNCAVRAQPVGKKQDMIWICRPVRDETLLRFTFFYGPVIPDGIKSLRKLNILWMKYSFGYKNITIMMSEEPAEKYCCGNCAVRHNRSVENNAAKVCRPVRDETSPYSSYSTDRLSLTG